MRLALEVVVDALVRTPGPVEWADVRAMFGPPSEKDRDVEGREALERVWGVIPDLDWYGPKAIGFGLKVANTQRSGETVLMGAGPDTRLERYLQRCASLDVEGNATSDIAACSRYYQLVSEMLALCQLVQDAS